MSRLSRITGVAAFAAAVVAVPATASAAGTPVQHPGVPAGQIQHTVTEFTITGSAGNDQHVMTDMYLTAKRGHTVSKNLDGSLHYEGVFTPKFDKDFDAATNTITIRPGYPTPPVQSADQEGASFQDGVDEGCFTELSRNGSIVKYELKSDPSCAEAGSHETVYFDTEQHHVLQRTSTIDGSDFKQVESLLVYDVKPLNATTKQWLKFGKHPGAKIVHEG